MIRRHFLAGVAVVGAALGTSVSAQEAEEFTIGVAIPSATHGFMGGLNFHAQDTIARLEKTYPQLTFVLATAGNAGKMVNDIEDMVATRDIDALVVLPFESEPLTSPVQAVKEAGIWVTVVDRGLSVPGIENLYVSGDNPGFGRTAGEYFKENLESGSKIVVLRGIPTTLDNERVDAFTAAIDGSGIEVLDMQFGNWNRDDAFNVMQDFLSKYPEIDAVWAADDDMAVGAMEAIAQAGRTEEMWIMGGAGMKEIIKRIMDKDPQLPANVTYPPAQISTAIELTALGLVSSTPVSGRFIIGSQLVTPENAEQFYFPDSPF
ncbi:twin-arginine translocation signal domain-containing protein [Cereibacter changlensis]|jgi:ribose transport system substrate-binding protein|uniref:Twin-arginine translocation signal domain-containing protein n=1 Tax=Cereibacter changlensis TaxID=402884 RepID=A0A4U0Z0Q9_9RHOB|nr:ABC transporter substrate-binding protein [Cereibacter changlensis]MBZ4689642.1 Periplasmic binding protein/LacI transcriptional regulator precursor [Cereibacter sp.]TKA96646.1 twin-arginine translocation signal domain-containing protein [Cereibacter changlensis]